MTFGRKEVFCRALKLVSAKRIATVDEAQPGVFISNSRLSAVHQRVPELHLCGAVLSAACPRGRQASSSRGNLRPGMQQPEIADNG